jgi:LPS sulfotransferase NodH
MNERGYVILGTPRSGTSHLCRLLSSTGVLGRPAEYLHPKRLPLLSGDRWESLKRLSSTPNGVFAVKAFFRHFADHKYRDLHARILTLPIVFVRRDDKLGQAISFARALQTEQWDSSEAPKRVPSYDASAITFCLKEILQHEMLLQMMFASRDLAVLDLTYEDLESRPQLAIGQIAAMIGVDDLHVQPSSSLRLQRDNTTIEWRRRYVAEHSVLTVPPLLGPGPRSWLRGLLTHVLPRRYSGK